ncbi:MAG: metal-transporting ATPase, partial [Eggerthellaceae bacterium]|nr:metal-transporting ATPase [Eggerthellaceae bacterium]
QAVVAYAEGRGAAAAAVDGFVQIPGQGVKGSVFEETCLAGNARMMADNGIDTAAYEQRAAAFADEGKTVLYFARAGELLGIIAVADVVKPTSAAAIAELRAMGMTTVMLTGDNERTAAAIQQQVGVDRVIAGVLPDGKEKVVRELAHDGKVAMVGDGINDAPALARADVGIAIGAGTDIAIESADVVLMHSDLADVPAALSLSRATMRNIKQNLFWALFYNAICIPVAAGALSWAGVNLNPMIAAAAMSLSSVCVVSNALRLRRWKPKKLATTMEISGDAMGSALDGTVSNGVEAALGSAPREEGIGGASGKDAEVAENRENPERKDVSMEKTLNVEGMMCMHCVSHVKKALEAIEGVSEVVVDLEGKTATVTLAADVADEALVAAVVDAGYEAQMA